MEDGSLPDLDFTPSLASLVRDLKGAEPTRAHIELIARAVDQIEQELIDLRHGMPPTQVG